jgi:hypothetical protein
MLHIHQPILEKMAYFQSIHKIPNIIFHGQSGTGKKTLVKKFIDLIYENDKERIKSFVMTVNCAHGKGIKFIRDELKFFAKTHIHSNGGDIFKSVVLYNADKLTIDAQSALRRCIELFSHTTRFFIIIEDKYKLLKPILSRFCEIYVPEPTVNGQPVNLYKYNLSQVYPWKTIKTQHQDWLKKELVKIKTTLVKDEQCHKTLVEYSFKLYEKGYSSLDLIQLLETKYPPLFGDFTIEKQYELLVSFNKVRKEFRKEQILILFILHFMFLSLEESLENISFM